MSERNIILNNKERFKGAYTIPEEKIKDAIKKACDKLASKIDIYTDGFPLAYYKGYKYNYRLGENDNWICGMHTGCFLLAYELTGDKKFFDVAKNHMQSYKKRIKERIQLQDHDVGFVLSPSCVAYYKLTGDEEIRECIIDAAEYFYNLSYSQKGGFILRDSGAVKENIEGGCRTMMDTMLNIPLFYWATEVTGDRKYAEAADSQAEITNRCLVRADASTYHHYQFDLETHAPMYGLTFQGNRDESTWSRGHSWGVLGYPIAYAYTKNDKYLEIQKELAYYFLNHLPEDNVPYWDFDFVSGDEPRDASAGLVSACGMLEAVKYMGDGDEVKEIYLNASARLIEGVIDMCSGDIGTEYDGLIHRVTAARKAELGVDGCGMYGDYFYLEALLRYVKPEWKMYW